jgi:flagellar biosynthetic protein FliO
MNAPPELIPSALKMLAALCAVLGGIFVILYFLRRLNRPVGTESQERLVRVLASHPLGVKKTVALVEVPGCVLVLGVGAERIQLLTRITDPVVLDRIRAHEPRGASSFYDHLLALTSRLKAGSHARD